MPATEKTWRDNRSMHVIFACTSVVLLAATVWMLVADHYDREWKKHTTATLGADAWMATHRRIQLATQDYFVKKQALEEDLSRIRATAPDKTLLKDFVIIADACDADEALEDLEGALDFSSLEKDLKSLKGALDELLKDVDAKRNDVVQAQEKVSQAEGTLQSLTTSLEKSEKDLKAAAKPNGTAAREDAQQAIDDLRKDIEQGHGELNTSEEAAEVAHQSMLESERIAGEARDELLNLLRDVVARVKTYEDNTDAKRKVKSAFLDEARSKFDLANAHHADEAESKRLQGNIDVAEQGVNEKIAIVEAAKEHRDQLKGILVDLTVEEEKLTKQMTDHETNLAALQTQLDEGRDSFLRRVLAGPILDIFGKGDNVIIQHWIPEKTLNFNFSKVARFDRCISCHRSMEKTYGGPTTPSYLPESHVTITLRTPAAAPPLNAKAKVLGLHFSAEDLDQLQNDAENVDPQLRREVMLMQIYGMRLVQGGPLNSDDVAVSFSWLQSPAAKAHLQTGDIIERINDVHIPSLDVAVSHLVETVEWGQPLILSVRRGVPHPYSTHPRLDLYGTATSPHPFGKMGCTLCHDGQGSSTDFINAVHVPDSEAQRARWGKKYGWYKNHHWPFPMVSKRFREATCLKCHHDVTELEPSERFPEPPAPKVVAGYNLVRRYGCFGCHEINGFDGPTKRIGPDLRAEPNYAAAAKQMLTQLPDRMPPLATMRKALGDELAILQTGLTNLEKADDEQRLAAKALRDAAKANKVDPNADQLAVINAQRDKRAPRIEKGKVDVATKQTELQAVDARIAELQLAEAKARLVAQYPEDHDARRRLVELVDDDAKRDKSDKLGQTFAPAMHKVASVLQDTDTPGSFRRVGPSLRHVGSKLGLAFLTAWLEDPTHFRPDTRMPRIFGLHDHMQGEKKAEAEGFEQVEIRAIAYYLLKQSQKFDPVAPPAEGTVAPASAERGKKLFEVRGCLACHKHDDFPRGKAVQGPDLSQIGAKLKLTAAGKGRSWLYSWVRQPNKYHARTVMPDLYLDESPNLELEDGTPTDTPTDAADDITEYLMTSDDWQPENADKENAGKSIWPPLKDVNDPTDDDAEILDALGELTELHLTKALRSKRLSKKYLKAVREGDTTTASRIAGAFAADELALKGLTAKNMAEKMLDYIGRRTISHRGCFGCHDIPGYEDAKPIGTGLADWGRKDPSKLAYEQIGGYLDHQHAEHDGHEDGDGEEEESLDDFFIRGLVSHHEVTRESFLWQKLREPRSFDYNKTENKGYLDQLRMPQFKFSSEQSEQIMTFVLGLVAEPPGDVFVYKPSPRRKAILEGSKVLAQFNCAGCHPMSMDRWKLTYDPGQFTFPTPSAGYRFLEHHFSEAEIASSSEQDLAGKLHAVLIGQGTLEDETGELAWFSESAPVARPNEDNLPIEYQFRLWEPALLDGRPLRVGKILEIPRSQVEITPGVGGELARLVQSALLRREAAAGTIPGARRQEIAGSIPPSLAGEGRKVQADWLHDFLLEPYRIRPAVVLRMPNFNMSADEATKIVDCFAALDNTDYPYQSDSRTRATHLAKLDDDYYEKLKPMLSEREVRDVESHKKLYGTSGLRLGDAMRIVTSNDYCVKCHRVGDFVPAKLPESRAPDLADVHRRLRPDFVLRWLANPARILPYTSMPQNIESGKQIPAALYHGTGRQQLDALVDLLMNYDRYMEHRTSIAKIVPPAPKVEDPQPPPANTKEE